MPISCTNDAEVTETDQLQSYGTVCVTFCDLGFTSSGTGSRTCQLNGLWDGTPLQCFGMHNVFLDTAYIFQAPPPPPPKKKFSGFVCRHRPARLHFKFQFFAMKRYPTAAKIAELIGILPSHRGKNVCPICEASLSHHTLYMGNLVPAYTCITYFPVGKNKKRLPKKHNKTAIDFVNKILSLYNIYVKCKSQAFWFLLCKSFKKTVANAFPMGLWWSLESARVMVVVVYVETTIQQ